ncbi:hypothetical protein D3C86_1638050 [compost metagenome]
MLDQRIVAGHQRAGRQGQIFKAHFSQQRDDGINHPVAFAKCMMERDSHPVLQAATLNRLFNGFAKLATLFFFNISQPRRSAMGRIKGLQIPQVGEIQVEKFCLIHCVILSDARQRQPRVPAPSARGQ